MSCAQSAALRPSLVLRPTQSIMYVPLQVNIFQRSMLVIVQYKYLRSCSGDFCLQNLILRTRSCLTGFISQSSWFFHIYLTSLFILKCFIPQLYQFLRGISGGPALNFFTWFIGAVKWICENPSLFAGTATIFSVNPVNFFSWFTGAVKWICGNPSLFAGTAMIFSVNPVNFCTKKRCVEERVSRNER